MKKIIIGTLILLLVLPFLATDREDAVLRSIYRLYGMKKYDEALQQVEKAVKDFGISKELLQIKYNILVKQEKYDEAVAFIDREIKRSGETEELVSAKFKVLFRQGKLKEALAAAVRKYEIAENKTPWDCINIMHVHLRMGNKQEALDWLQEAVSRGFISYRILADQKYSSLAKEKRLYEIIESIKAAIGLGNPARNFSVKLLNGEEFILLRQRGKVVLADFWASWCDPCRQEMPNLKKYYREFKDRGFEIIGISLDSDVQKLKEYIRVNNLEWKITCSGKVWKDDTAVRYGVNSIPSTWLIDKKGFLRSFGLKGEELRRTVATLLAE